MNIALIPARMGSQRLKKKNLRLVGGVSLIARAIRKCRQADCFDEIWVNSEDTEFGAIADAEGVSFHLRPAELGNNVATSEQYVTEFLQVHECDRVFQVHTIAPLLSVGSIRGFVEEAGKGEWDCLLSVENIQLECIYDGRPVNFDFARKTNSQELKPVQRICWSITGWRRAAFLDAAARGECATYAGKVGFFALDPLESHVIKTERDLRIADALLPLCEAHTDNSGVSS